MVTQVMRRIAPDKFSLPVGVDEEMLCDSYKRLAIASPRQEEKKLSMSWPPFFVL